MKTMENHKLFKTSNNVSALDITPWLDGVYKKNKDGEEEYKGKMIFAIWEKGKGYLKAYVDKSKTKVLMNTIREGRFTEVFPNGFEDYGMGKSEKGELRARTFSIKTGKNKKGEDQLMFVIEEGPGEYIVDRATGETKGAVKKIKTDVKTTKFITTVEALQMSTEVGDYIYQRELKALMDGKPLCTITHFNPEGKVEENLVKEYTFEEGPHSGKGIKDLTDDELKDYIKEVKTETYDNQELKKVILSEAKRRMDERKTS